MFLLGMRFKRVQPATTKISNTTERLFDALNAGFGAL